MLNYNSNMKNQRYPFLDLQNKKSKDTENAKQIQSASKNQLSPLAKHNVTMSQLSNINSSQQNQKSLTVNIQTVKEPIQQGIDQATLMGMTEEEIGETEYKLCLKKALRESIDENEQLREKIKALSLENEELKKDIEDKDEAILELAQFYEYCQKNHLNNNEELFKGNTDTIKANEDDSTNNNNKQDKRKNSY